jgi:hypothetical protein
MKAFEAIPVLNRLLALLCRSLPAYLADAKPWARADRRQIRTALDRLVADQRIYAQRVADAIVQRGGRPNPGPFAPEFAAKNDLSLEFLLREVIDYQEHDVLSIEHCAAQLEGEPSLHALAEEILGNTKGHRDILREMMKEEG